jgi:hypothetical protein
MDTPDVETAHRLSKLTPVAEASDILHTLAALLHGVEQIMETHEAVASETFIRSDVLDRACELAARAKEFTTLL